jgi:hypothetical protein
LHFGAGKSGGQFVDISKNYLRSPRNIIVGEKQEAHEYKKNLL